MIETICVNCRQRYPLGQDHVCPKPAAKKSTASGKDRTSGAQMNVSSRPLEGGAELAAGTQAPPVDTPVVSNMDLAAAIEWANDRKPKHKDRHKPGYQAQKQREYRARKKNEAKAN